MDRRIVGKEFEGDGNTPLRDFFYGLVRRRGTAFCATVERIKK